MNEEILKDFHTEETNYNNKNVVLYLKNYKKVNVKLLYLLI